MSDQKHLQSSCHESFPILDEMDFFNHAGVAPLSKPAADAMIAYAKHTASKAYIQGSWYKQAQHIKTLAARMINAPSAANIAYVPSTSAGLSLLARGLDWRRGDNVIITSIEFPANRYPWQDLAKQGVELIEIEPDNEGRIDVEDILEAITDRTRLVSISHVQFSSGFRIDLSEIAKMVHRAGGLLCIDAIQSVGAMPVDVQAWGVDFLSADSHKWMLGPEGCGFVYCEEDLIQMLHPGVVGWMNMPIRKEYTDYRFEFHTDARRFEPGSYNLAGIMAMGASLELLLETGLDNVWATIEMLTDHLCDRLNQKGYKVFSPRGAGEKSGIVSFSAADVSRHQAIIEMLEKQNIHIALRQGRLRVSPHFYNTLAQMDRLVDALP